MKRGRLLKKSERKALAQKRYEALGPDDPIPPEPWRRLRFEWVKDRNFGSSQEDEFTERFDLKGHDAILLRTKSGRWCALVNRSWVLNQGRCTLKEGKFHGPWPEGSEDRWCCVFLRRRDAKRMVEAYLSQQKEAARLKPAWTKRMTSIMAAVIGPMLGGYSAYAALKRAG